VKIHRHIRRCLLITYMLFCLFISRTLLHNAMRKVRDVFSGHPVLAKVTSCSSFVVHSTSSSSSCRWLGKIKKTFKNKTKCCAKITLKTYSHENAIQAVKYTAPRGAALRLIRCGRSFIPVSRQPQIRPGTKKQDRYESAE